MAKCVFCEREADYVDHYEIHHLVCPYFLSSGNPLVINICKSCHAKIHAYFRRVTGRAWFYFERLIEKIVNGEVDSEMMLIIENLLDCQRFNPKLDLGTIAFTLGKWASVFHERKRRGW